MSLSHILALLCALLFTLSFTYAQNPPVAPAKYDEAKIPKFELTNPLKTNDGRTVDTPKLWNEVRRPELLKLFEEQMFGKATRFEKGGKAIPYMQCFHRNGGLALNDKVARHQFQIVFSADALVDDTAFTTIVRNNIDNDGTFPRFHVVDLLVYLPIIRDPAKPIPLFLGLNFHGNHTVATDPGIRLGTVWKNGKPEPAKEEERGSSASRWQVERIVERGYAVATAYYQDIEPDFNDGIKYGVRRFHYAENEEPKPEEANTIATWTWGLGQILEAILAKHINVTLNIDPKKIAVIGHSRLGKTALWAGATNPEFALVISNDSGCGGAAHSRREFGETVHRINTSFPHWFCGNFKKYNHDVNSLPFDQHELIALIAPRPVYIASAVEDQWADPKGEFLSALYADPVYKLLGTDGIAGVTEMPPIDTPVGGTIGYHIRTGEHDVTEYDWEQYLNFADKHFK
jgi:hypothetical protein